MRIIGIDPGTRNVGYGIVEEREGCLICLDHGCISSKDPVMANRLVAIYEGLTAAIARWNPAAAAVETVFTSVNPRTAIAIGEGRGVAVLSAAQCGMPVQGYEPALVKRTVAGNGRADKEQVRSMVKVLLNLAVPPATDHESDALALAITHARHAEQTARTGGCIKKTFPTRGPLPDFVLKQLPPSLLGRLGR